MRYRCRYFAIRKVHLLRLQYILAELVVHMCIFHITVHNEGPAPAITILAEKVQRVDKS
jgi:hypothetical protein